VLFILCLVSAASALTPQQDQVTTAGLELANVFQQLNTFNLGVKVGSTTLLPGAGNYNLTLPDQPPAVNSFLGNDPATPGKLTFLPSCSGVSFAGDLGGNSSSQNVVGIMSIPIDLTVTPTDGMTLKYNAAKNKWVPSL